MTLALSALESTKFYKTFGEKLECAERCVHKSKNNADKKTCIRYGLYRPVLRDGDKTSYLFSDGSVLNIDVPEFDRPLWEIDGVKFETDGSPEFVLNVTTSI